MSRRSLPRPPSVAELVELARLLAADAPALLPELLWCICRSSRAAEAFRTLRPSGPRLATLHRYPAGERLIASSRAGTAWLHKWTEAAATLDKLLPLVAGKELPPRGR